MRFFKLFIFFSGLICFDAYAELLPSQVDLKAAYCLQVSQDAINQLNVPYPNETELQRQLITDIINKANANLRHLQRYLVSRINYLDLLGVTAAKQQALDDESIKNQEVTHCQLCQDISCENSCISSVNAKFPNCNDLSFLPF